MLPFPAASSLHTCKLWGCSRVLEEMAAPAVVGPLAAHGHIQLVSTGLASAPDLFHLCLLQYVAAEIRMPATGSPSQSMMPGTEPCRWSCKKCLLNCKNRFLGVITAVLHPSTSTSPPTKDWARLFFSHLGSFHWLYQTGPQPPALSSWSLCILRGK